VKEILGAMLTVPKTLFVLLLAKLIVALHGTYVWGL